MMFVYLRSLSALMGATRARAIEHSAVLIQSADFDVHNQDQLHLSPQCHAAVSLDSNLPNQYCQGNCVGLELGVLSPEEFKSSCIIDDVLLKFADAAHEVGNSSCFAPVAPQAEHVHEIFEVTFPSSCQSACQDSNDCVWFTVMASEENDTLICLLLDAFGIAGPLAEIASGESRDLCDHHHGEPVDCALGSVMCLTDARQVLSDMDYKILSVEESDVRAVSGPKYCRASSNNYADTACTVSQTILGNYAKRGSYPSSLEFKIVAALQQFHGIDHLFGGGSIFDHTSWNELFPLQKRSLESVMPAPFIDGTLVSMISSIMSA